VRGGVAAPFQTGLRVPGDQAGGAARGQGNRRDPLTCPPQAGGPPRQTQGQEILELY